ncbi:MAG: energy transducer TonB [Alistipes sp.]|nr:energy transducer TonB [Alistipes sp.]
MHAPASQPAVERPRVRRCRRLDLPFDNRREDVGEWTYRHRIGLCVTLICYLLLMIGFVGSKIVVGKRASMQGMYIDLETLAELESERDRLQREIEQKMQREQADWRSVQNRISNENATDERLQDDRGTNAAALNDAAAEALQRMQANRAAYEQGLAEEQALYEKKGGQGKDQERKDSRVKGRVTVSFTLTDPVRHSRYLDIPAYLCESGGEVLVQITVNRGGEVVAARVREGGDACMRETALRAARQSIFNIDNTAPERQVGTILYTFIPQ